MKLEVSLLVGAAFAVLFAFFAILGISGLLPVIHLHYTSLLPLNMLTRVAFGILALFSVLVSGFVLFYGLKEN